MSYIHTDRFPVHLEGKYMVGADPGFLVGGGARPPGRGANIQIFQIFPKKLHEIKKILVWGRPPGSATAWVGDLF